MGTNKPRDFRSFLRGFLLFALIGAVLFSWYGYLLLPWEQEYREAAMPVLASELAAFSSTQGTSEPGEIRETEPIRGPSITHYLSLATQCEQGESKYKTLAEQAGWTYFGQQIFHETELEYGYQKCSGGYKMILRISCTGADGSYISTTASSYDYIIRVQVPFPYNVLVLRDTLHDMPKPY